MTDGQGLVEPDPTHLGPPVAASGRPAHREGQGLVEYGLILVIVAVVCVVSLVFFGDQLSSLLQLIMSAV